MWEGGVMLNAHETRGLFGLVWYGVLLFFWWIVAHNKFLFRLKRCILETSCLKAEIELDTVVLLWCGLTSVWELTVTLYPSGFCWFCVQSVSSHSLFWSFGTILNPLLPRLCGIYISQVLTVLSLVLKILACCTWRSHSTLFHLQLSSVSLAVSHKIDSSFASLVYLFYNTPNSYFGRFWTVFFFFFIIHSVKRQQKLISLACIF